MNRHIDPARRWLVVGGACALLAAGALVFDIVLSMVPGWEITTAPAEAAGWLEQASSQPLLAMRNLDLLNALVAIVTVPLFVALYISHARTTKKLATAGLLIAVLGAVVFAANNVAIPMVLLGRDFASATTEAARVAMRQDAAALVARGGHGTLGAFPGFLLSTLGTLVMAVAVARGDLIGRRMAVAGVVGASTMVVYVVAMAFLSVPTSLVLAIAAPGGLLTIAWYVAVGLGLIRRGTVERTAIAPRLAAG